MAVVFDTVTAEVQPKPQGTLDPSPPAPTATRLDANELTRELERRAERHARLQAD